jgi:hypothetical protein
MPGADVSMRGTAAVAKSSSTGAQKRGSVPSSISQQKILNIIAAAAAGKVVVQMTGQIEAAAFELRSVPARLSRSPIK